MVFVNPTDMEQTVNLSALGYAGSFYDKLGKPVSEFPLKAGSGEMIFTYVVKTPAADVNADGVVDHLDLQLFNDAWKLNVQDTLFNESLNLNGDLVIEGKKEVTVNRERQILSIRGIVRSFDVAPTNVVMSTAIANMEVKFDGKGVVADANKPGWLFRLIQIITPF